MTADFRETAMAALASRPKADPEWLAARRAQAESEFQDHGFPTAKDEAWRFTSVRSITRLPFAPRSGGTTVRGDVPEGVSVERLADVLEKQPRLLEPHLGRLSKPEFFSALNAAMFDDALVVRIAKGAVVEAPIELGSDAGADGSADSEPTVVYQRLFVLAEENSQATIVERHEGTSTSPHLSNSVTEILVGKNAKLSHYLVHQGWSTGHRIAAVAVEQARSSSYASHVFTFGGALSRLDMRCVLAGEGAECALDGLYLARDGEHVDHQTLVDHASAHCSSQQKYKGILDGKGRGVFDGTVVVRRDAQKSDAHQENRNLLLSDTAIVNTKPHLEIDADDVTCSHGATVGQLDQNQLFYLRARGIDAAAAKAVLTHAFASELIERVKLAPLAEELGKLLRKSLPAGELVEDAL